MFIKCRYNIIPIIDRLRERDWLIANFETPDSDIYNPVDYVYNRKLYGVDYHLHLDRNIYSYICSINTQKITSEIRDSIGLLNFAWMAQIIVAPTLAVYEGINYSEEKVEKALDELELFRRIDNSDPEQTARFATGEQDTFPLFNTFLENREELKKELVRYERLFEWNSIYLLLMKCIEVHINPDIKNKLQVFVGWMLRDFRLSSPVFFFAIFLFSSKPPRGLNKYKISMGANEKRRSLFNMTWDLFIVHNYMQQWAKKDSTTEIIFASADNGIKAFMRPLIDFQKTNNPEILARYMDAKDAKETIKALEYTIPENERIYLSDKWSIEYRDNLIQELEKRLVQ